MNVDLSRPILVTGASGKTGRSVVSRFVAARAKVRVFVRRQEAGDELLAAGASEMVLGDLLDDDALRRAIVGTGQIMHICPPMHPAEDDIAARIIAHGRDAGISRLVLYSVLHPAIDVPHHRRKLIAETALIDSGLPYTILQPCRYMQHLAPIWKEVAATGIHRMPFATDAAFSLVDLHDLAEASCKVLTEGGHEFATYQLCGPQRLSQIDCAEILSRHLGRTISAEAKPLEVFLRDARKAGMPEARIETMSRMNAHYDAHGLLGNSNVLRWLLGREPTDFAAYVARDFPKE
jgi:uncharacterized protein YbjT (DUF2867 family)